MLNNDYEPELGSARIEHSSEKYKQKKKFEGESVSPEKALNQHIQKD